MLRHRLLFVLLDFTSPHQTDSVFWCKTAYMVHKMKTGWQESETADFMILPGRNFALEQRAVMSINGQRREKGKLKIKYLKMASGSMRWGLFFVRLILCAFVWQE